ncbi:MAG: metallophosphoesterase family protein [Syntrophomonadaceae bacterium]
MLIGVLSDTHLPRRGRELPAVLLKALEKADLIIHAGDFTTLAVLQRLQGFAPVKAVYGNVDSDEVLETLNQSEQFCLEGLSIGLIHGFGTRGTSKTRAAEAFPVAQCVVYGHSHIPGIEFSGNQLLFNPGSPTDKRSAPYPTYGLLSVKPGMFTAEILSLPGNETFAHISCLFSKTIQI